MFDSSSIARTLLFSSNFIFPSAGIPSNDALVCSHGCCSCSLRGVFDFIRLFESSSAPRSDHPIMLSTSFNSCIQRQAARHSAQVLAIIESRWRCAVWVVQLCLPCTYRRSLNCQILQPVNSIISAFNNQQQWSILYLEIITLSAQSVTHADVVPCRFASLATAALASECACWPRHTTSPSAPRDAGQQHQRLNPACSQQHNEADQFLLRVDCLICDASLARCRLLRCQMPQLSHPGVAASARVCVHWQLEVARRCGALQLQARIAIAGGALACQNRR